MEAGFARVGSVKTVQGSVIGLAVDTVTVTAAVPVFAPLVAVMVAAPAVTPVTSPLASTVATPEALLVHVTVRPASPLPAESFRVAARCTVLPTAKLSEAGFTRTERTCGQVTGTHAVA